jgi:hypothetical protein
MQMMAKPFAWGVLAYILPTFPLGFIWHLVLFKDYYAALDVFRPDVVIAFGIGSMVVQGVAWSYVYARLFAGEPVLRGAFKFGVLAAPLAWSFLVVAVAAKHKMASVSGYLLIETAFVAVHYVVVSPLIALAHSAPRR